MRHAPAVVAVVLSLAVHAALWMFMKSPLPGMRRVQAPKLEISHVELSVGKDEEKPPRAAEETGKSAARETPVPRLPVPDVETMSVRASPVGMKTPVPRARELDPPPVEVVMTEPAPSPSRARVEAPARPVKAISPKYPRGARRRGEEGVVEADVTVEADGAVSSVEILKSSGYRELDDAAREAVMKASFTPARSGGTNTASTARISLRFRLR